MRIANTLGSHGPGFCVFAETVLKVGKYSD